MKKHLRVATCRAPLPPAPPILLHLPFYGNQLRAACDSHSLWDFLGSLPAPGGSTSLLPPADKPFFWFINLKAGVRFRKQIWSCLLTAGSQPRGSQTMLIHSRFLGATRAQHPPWLPFINLSTFASDEHQNELAAARTLTTTGRREREREKKKPSN